MAERRIVVGMDIGGSKIAAAVVSEQGEILNQESIVTEAERGFEHGLRRIEALLGRLLARAPGQPVAIGIGCAGPVDPARGTIDNPYTLPTWDGVNIVRPLRERFGVPVALENDADAAAMGEVWLGAGHGGRIVVMVTIGTGIGGAVILDGQIYRGIDGAHPEIGHQCLDPAGPPCYCGARGCWESLASGTAIANAARAQMPAWAGASIDGASVIRRARRGDPIAVDVVDRAAQATARAVFNLVNLYVPEIVVLGGGVMDAYDLFEPALRETLACDTMAPIAAIRVERAALGNDAGIVGAARIALDIQCARTCM
jgi:glucokinase